MTSNNMSATRDTTLNALWFPPRGPYESDPGWREAWFWIGVPVGLLIFLVVAGVNAPLWYLRWIEPEG